MSELLLLQRSTSMQLTTAHAAQTDDTPLTVKQALCLPVANRGDKL